MAAQEFEQPPGAARLPQVSGEPVSSGLRDDVDLRVEQLSRKLRSLESKLIESREANERIQERFIQTLEVLDARISSGREATAAKLESLIGSLGVAIDELKGVVRAEAKNTEEAVWRGLGQLETTVSQTGAETHHRLARAVATLSIAADEWRASAPTLATKAEESVVERMMDLDAAVARGQQSISEHLERTIVQLADSIQSWRSELEEVNKRSQDRLWNGLNTLEKRLHDQMRDLENRIHERQMAIVTLIVGGGTPAAGLSAPSEGQNLEPKPDHIP